MRRIAGQVVDFHNGEPNMGSEFFSACQTIYSETGDVLFPGQWDSRGLFNAITVGKEEYWKERKVLDIGSNTSGLSVEIARRGAHVVAAEPDPRKNNRFRCKGLLDEIVENESLQLEFVNNELFEVHDLGSFDTVLCLGLLYHFRDPQYVLDYLSSIDMNDLILSTQTCEGDGLQMLNRAEKGLLPLLAQKARSDRPSGWHMTHSMLRRMMEWAGFTDITPLGDTNINFPNKPSKRITNSAYYRAKKLRSVDPTAVRKVFI